MTKRKGWTEALEDNDYELLVDLASDEMVEDDQIQLLAKLAAKQVDLRKSLNETNTELDAVLADQATLEAKRVRCELRLEKLNNAQKYLRAALRILANKPKEIPQKKEAQSVTLPEQNKPPPEPAPQELTPQKPTKKIGDSVDWAKRNLSTAQQVASQQTDLPLDVSSGSVSLPEIVSKGIGGKGQGKGCRTKKPRQLWDDAVEKISVVADDLGIGMLKIRQWWFEGELEPINVDAQTFRVGDVVKVGSAREHEPANYDTHERITRRLDFLNTRFMEEMIKQIDVQAFLGLSNPLALNFYKRTPKNPTAPLPDPIKGPGCLLYPKDCVRNALLAKREDDKYDPLKQDTLPKGLTYKRGRYTIQFQSKVTEKKKRYTETLVRGVTRDQAESYLYRLRELDQQGKLTWPGHKKKPIQAPQPPLPLDTPIPTPVSTIWRTCEEMASVLGLYSKEGKPHARAVGAIIRNLQQEGKIPALCPEKWWDDITVKHRSQNRNVETRQYHPKVLDLVRQWYIEKGYPTSIIDTEPNTHGTLPVCTVVYNPKSNGPTGFNHLDTSLTKKDLPN